MSRSKVFKMTEKWMSNRRKKAGITYTEAVEKTETIVSSSIID